MELSQFLDADSIGGVAHGVVERGVELFNGSEPCGTLSLLVKFDGVKSVTDDTTSAAPNAQARGGQHDCCGAIVGPRADRRPDMGGRTGGRPEENSATVAAA